MTDTVTSENTDIYFWNILYVSSSFCVHFEDIPTEIGIRIELSFDAICSTPIISVLITCRNFDTEILYARSSFTVETLLLGADLKHSGKLRH